AVAASSVGWGGARHATVASFHSVHFHDARFHDGHFHNNNFFFHGGCCIVAGSIFFPFAGFSAFSPFYPFYPFYPYDPWYDSSFGYPQPYFTPSPDFFPPAAYSPPAQDGSAAPATFAVFFALDSDSLSDDALSTIRQAADAYHAQQA